MPRLVLGRLFDECWKMSLPVFFTSHNNPKALSVISELNRSFMFWLNSCSLGIPFKMSGWLDIQFELTSNSKPVKTKVYSELKVSLQNIIGSLVNSLFEIILVNPVPSFFLFWGFNCAHSAIVSSGSNFTSSSSFSSKYKPVGKFSGIFWTWTVLLSFLSLSYWVLYILRSLSYNSEPLAMKNLVYP